MSDQIKDHNGFFPGEDGYDSGMGFCEQCEEQDDVDAFGFCPTCGGYMCSTCLKDHACTDGAVEFPEFQS
jgi:hypothetical protein